MKNRKMSDQIKTQHGTIGLLMAECEQLRRDLVAEEQRHHSACDDWAKERRRADKLQADLAEAKKANSRLQERRNEIELQLSHSRSRLHSDYVQLKQELAQAKGLLRNIVSNLHCNEDIDQELYDAAEFLNGTSGRTPDRPAITN